MGTLKIESTVAIVELQVELIRWLSAIETLQGSVLKNVDQNNCALARRD